MFLHTKKSAVARIVLIVFSFVMFVTSFIGCTSYVLKKVEEQESAVLKLIIARDMINQTRYTLAQRILENIREEYPLDVQIAVEVDYEIAFITLSRKYYKKAKQQLEAIIAQYDEMKNENTLPQWPYYLSKKLLETTVYPALEKRSKKVQKKSEEKQAS